MLLFYYQSRSLGAPASSEQLRYGEMIEHTLDPIRSLSIEPGAKSPHATPRKIRFGQLPPRHRFALNPHASYRASRYNGLTYPRKFALLIHVQPGELRVLGKTCKYCSKCEFIIAHQDELEAELSAHFEQTRPDVIGNDYLVLGTVERKTWREGTEQPKTLDELLVHTADFKEYLEIEYQPGGWFPADADR